MKPRKILFLSVHGDPLAQLGGIQAGGQNVYVRELVRSLDALGMSVEVFTHWSDLRLPRIQMLGEKSRVIRLEGGRKGYCAKDQLFELLPKFQSELEDYIDNPNQYGLIHSNYWLSGAVGMKLQEKMMIPRVHTSHSLGAVRSKAVSNVSRTVGARIECEKKLLAKSSRIIATTYWEKEVLTNFYKIEPLSIEVVPCGINNTVFHKGFISFVPRTTLARKRILFAGRFEENKGLAILLEALAILVKSGNLKTKDLPMLLIAGGDPLTATEAGMSLEKRGYLKYIDEQGLVPYVSFVGPVSHEELSVYYQNSTITVVPSYYESFGLVAVEAMACGCPVVASKTGGLQHNVEHQKTGLLVEPRSPQRLADALHLLLTNSTLRSQMSLNAETHGKKYSWKSVAERIIDVYSEVIPCSFKATPRQNSF